MSSPDLTIIYYTSNWLDTRNPFFLAKTRKQLRKAAGELPIICVSQKPTDFGENICVGDIGRTHLNLYRQILIGCKAAKTKYVAMAEDDILYSHQHFHDPEGIEIARRDVFSYDMNKVSLFTWSKPPMFSFRTKRMVVNSLISKRDYLIDALEERFAKFPDESKVPLYHWGDPGRYEQYLGVTVRRRKDWYSPCPNIVFSHEHAMGYLVQGNRKRLGDLRIIELADWGRAEDILKLYYGPNIS